MKRIFAKGSSIPEALHIPGIPQASHRMVLWVNRAPLQIHVLTS